MAEMNQLLDDAAQCSTDLAAQAIAAASAAHDLVQQAKALGDRATDDLQRLHQQYAETVAAVDHATNQSADNAYTAMQLVHGVTPDAIQTANALKDMVGGLIGELGHLGGQRARVMHELDASAHEAETGFHDLASKLQGLHDHMDARLGDIHADLGRLEDTIHESTASSKKANESFYEQLNELVKHAAETTKLANHAVEQILAEVATRFVDAANGAVTDHNQLVATIREGYLDESNDTPEPETTYVTTAFDKIRDAVTRMDQVADVAGTTLQATAAAIVEQGENAVTALAEAVHDLEDAAEKVHS